MDNIAEGAQQLIQLAARIKEELPPIALGVTTFHDEVFAEVINIVGNLHDPLVIDAQVHVRHAEELLEDYVKTIDGLRSRVNSTGHKLMRMQ
jgi:hypothetical protein